MIEKPNIRSMCIVQRCKVKPCCVGQCCVVDEVRVMNI